MPLGSSSGEARRAVIRTGHAEHVVPVLQQLHHQGRTDESARTGHEDAHGNLLLDCLDGPCQPGEESRP
jgi:hypothetical protein